MENIWYIIFYLNRTSVFELYFNRIQIFIELVATLFENNGSFRSEQLHYNKKGLFLMIKIWRNINTICEKMQFQVLLRLIKNLIDRSTSPLWIFIRYSNSSMAVFNWKLHGISSNSISLYSHLQIRCTISIKRYFCPSSKIP